MRNVRALTLAGALLMLSAAPALAQDQPPPAPADLNPLLRTMDAQDQVDRLDEIIAAGRWDVPVEIRDEALRMLFTETALLLELDALISPTPGLDRIHAAYGPWPDVPDERLLDALFEVDRQLAEKKQLIIQFGVEPGLFETALLSLTPSEHDDLVDGRTDFIAPRAYADAIGALVSEGTTDDLAAEGLAGLQMGAPLNSALSEFAESGRLRELLNAETSESGEIAENLAQGNSNSNSGGSPWTVALIAVAVSVAAGAALFAWKRRGRRHESEASVEVIEAQRLLTDSLDEAQVGDVAIDAARRLARSDDALLLRRTVEGLRQTGDTAVFVNSGLQRVIATGQPLVEVVDSDPITGSTPTAVAAVPVVSNGEVIAVLVAMRSPDQPFDDDTRSRLELLAPALGGALSSADTLGSMENLAWVDGLTSLSNRRRLDGDLQTTLASAVARNLPLGFAMIDVDHFKEFNDTHGHEAGDEALRAVARAVERTVRATDVVYRYGGEEFSVLLPGATLKEATAAAERIRIAVETTPVAGEETQPGGRLTVSVGVSTLESGPSDRLASRADKALYEAKARGRNQSVVL